MRKNYKNYSVNIIDKISNFNKSQE
jgi:hypothetical protein